MLTGALLPRLPYFGLLVLVKTLRELNAIIIYTELLNFSPFLAVTRLWDSLLIRNMTFFARYCV